MGNANLPESRFDARYIRLIVLVPFGWIVFFSLIPDFLMRVSGHPVPWVSAVTWGTGIVLICSFTGLLITRAINERRISVLVLTGILSLVVSEVFRIALSIGFFDTAPVHEWLKELRAVDNLVNGLGLVLIALAFFHTIISMLASRQQLLDERTRLSAEIARREHVEQSLREREALLHGISASALDAIIVMDNAGYVSYWNSSAERILGYGRDEIIGKSVHALLVPAARQQEYSRGVSAWQHSGQGPVVGRTVALKAVRKDGTEIDAELSVSSVEISGQWHAVGILRDVTERKQAEEVHRTILQTAMDGFWIADREGRLLDVNDAYCRFSGYTREELLNMRIQDLDATESPEEVAAHIEEIRAKGLGRFETRHRRKDGGIIDVEVSANSMLTAGDHQYVFVRDLTGRRQAAALLEEQRVKMIESARLSSLGTMAGGVAHEINNPLAVIAGCAEQLENLVENPHNVMATTKRLAGMMRRNASRIQRIVQGLRELSRDGSCDPFTATPVATIITDVLELCQERFRLRGILIENGCAAEPLPIECRPTQVCQVILNLLNNSLQAVGTLPEKWIHLDVVDFGEQVEIAVTDSGTGIPKEIADHIFTPFFTTKFEERGLGLGLSISRSVIETHHGELVLDATCARTRFVIRLPKRQVSSAAV